MKKISLLLALFLSLSLLGCAKEPAPVTAPTLDETLPDDFDFEGKRFVILEGSYNGKSTTNDTLFYFTEGSAQKDLMTERVHEFETKHNCSVTTDIRPFSNFHTDVLNSGAVAAEDWDVLASCNGGFPDTFADAGVLVPMNEVSEYIDLSDHDKYGSKGELEAVTVGSVTYAVTPAYFPGAQNFGNVPIGVFLEGYMKKNNLPSIREYLEKKTWTWDTFLTCLTDCTVSEGDYRVKAIALADFVFCNAAMLSNGVNFVVKTDAGLASGVDSNQTLEALDFCKKVLNEYEDSILYNKYEWCTEFKALEAENAVMCLLGAWTITSEVPFALNEYGLFPFPWGPSGEYGVCRTLSDGIVSVMIPLVAEDPDYSALLIRDLLDPLPGYETREALNSYYSNIFFDDRDIELFLSLKDNVSFSYFNRGGYNFSGYVIQKLKNNSPSEVLETYKGSMDEVVENYIIPNGEYLFG